MRHPSFFRSSFFALPLFFLLVIGTSCSSSTSADPEPDPDKTGTINEPGIQAELAEETVLVAENVLENGLLEEDEENFVYVFDEEALAGSGLNPEPGEILLLEKKALRRITSVSNNNGQLTIQTSGDVTLEEAFKELEIDTSEPLRFTPDVLSKAVMEMEGRQFSPNKVENGLANWEYQVGAYKAIGSVQIDGNKAIVKLVLHKNLAAGGVALSAEAVIEEMSSDLKLQINDHKTQNFEFKNSGMQGKVDLSIAAAGGGIDPEFGFGPLTMFQFPFTVGPVPVMVAVKVQTVAKLTVRSQASATAKTSISYNGVTGVSYDGSSVKGVIGGGIDVPIFDSSEGDSAPAGLDGYGVDTQYGFAAPVLEVQLFGNIIVPFIRPEFYIGSSFHWAPICKNVHVRYGVKAGIGLRFLGRNLTSFDDIPLVEEVRRDGYSDRENCSHHYDVNKRAFPYDDFITFDSEAGPQVPYRGNL